MSYNMGDTVQVGKGKVEWTVQGHSGSLVYIESAKGAVKWVEGETLTLLKAATTRTDEILENSMNVFVRAAMGQGGNWGTSAPAKPAKVKPSKPQRLQRGKRGGKLRVA